MTYMYCPKCGFLLRLEQVGDKREDLYCSRGDMFLSQVVRRKLEERFCNPEGTAAILPESRRFRPGGHWFCPGDGEVLDEYLECKQCGKHINDLTYMLVELHPHKDKNGRW